MNNWQEDYKCLACGHVGTGVEVKAETVCEACKSFFILPRRIVLTAPKRPKTKLKLIKGGKS